MNELHKRFAANWGKNQNRCFRSSGGSIGSASRYMGCGFDLFLLKFDAKPLIGLPLLLPHHQSGVLRAHSVNTALRSVHKAPFPSSCLHPSILIKGAMQLSRTSLALLNTECAYTSFMNVIKKVLVLFVFLASRSGGGQNAAKLFHCARFDTLPRKNKRAPLIENFIRAFSFKTPFNYNIVILCLSCTQRKIKALLALRPCVFINT